MEAPEFLPLGSICTVTGNNKKLVIIARGLSLTTEQNGQQYYDYGGCLYPEGLIGDAILYFNHDAISELVWSGYTDDDNIEHVKNLSEAVERLTIPKADPPALSLENL